MFVLGQLSLLSSLLVPAEWHQGERMRRGPKAQAPEGRRPLRSRPAPCVGLSTAPWHRADLLEERIMAASRNKNNTIGPLPLHAPPPETAWTSSWVPGATVARFHQQPNLRKRVQVAESLCQAPYGLPIRFYLVLFQTLTCLSIDQPHNLCGHPSQNRSAT